MANVSFFLLSAWNAVGTSLVVTPAGYFWPLRPRSRCAWVNVRRVRVTRDATCPENELCYNFYLSRFCSSASRDRKRWRVEEKDTFLVPPRASKQVSWGTFYARL